MHGFAILVVPVLVLLTTVPASLLWQDLVVFPLTVFPQVEHYHTQAAHSQLFWNKGCGASFRHTAVIAKLAVLYALCGRSGGPGISASPFGGGALAQVTLVAAERFSGYAYILLFA